MSRVFLPDGMLDPNSAPYPSPTPKNATSDQLGPLEMACETQATPEPRKIVQISTIGESEDFFPLLVGLCDDGTLWSTSLQPGNIEWHALPAIPQGPVA